MLALRIVSALARTPSRSVTEAAIASDLRIALSPALPGVEWSLVAGAEPTRAGDVAGEPCKKCSSTECRPIGTHQRSFQVIGKKGGHQVRALGVDELLAAVGAAVKDDQAAGELEGLVAALELEGLVDRRLRVLVAVDEQQRGVAGSMWKTGLASRARSGTSCGCAPSSSCSAGTRTLSPCGVDCAR